MSEQRLRLFEAHGIELEYMIVDRETLDVLPVCDALMAAVAGRETADLERGEVGWSNELALHVLEFKTNGPAQELQGLAAKFQADVQFADAALEPLGGRLLGGAMHPWMDPARETRLWPHENGPVYQAFDRIFGCAGHGWSNLQSLHINLPFADDDEMGRLHAAMRLVLPLLPALAAASPIDSGRPTGLLDARLEHYRKNCLRVPSVTGGVIPEQVWTRHDYEEGLLGGIYRDLAELDPDGVLRHEFVNARGAIARFDRWAIEIRLLDIQEYPAADLAIARLVTATVAALCDERWSTLAEQQAFTQERLRGPLHDCIADAERAVVSDEGLLAALGRSGPMPAGRLWRELADELLGDASDAEFRPALAVLFDEGSLARRLLAATGPDPSHGRLVEVWRELADCLHEGRPFRG